MGMYDDGTKALEHLVGQVITEVWWSSELLTFVNDQGHTLSFEVEGDCCSHSYFHDFIGLDKLLGNKVIETGEIPLNDEDRKLLSEVKDADDSWGEDIRVYGYKIVSEHPKWGPVTTVFSFRNSSNGYYGGWMYNVEGRLDSNQEKLTADKVGG